MMVYHPIASYSVTNHELYHHQYNRHRNVHHRRHSRHRRRPRRHLMVLFIHPDASLTAKVLVFL